LIILILLFVVIAGRFVVDGLWCLTPL